MLVRCLQVVKSVSVTRLLLAHLPLLSFCQQSQIALLHVEAAPCDASIDIFRVQNRIVSQSVEKGIFKLSVGMVMNCAGMHNVTLVFSADTLRINFEEGREAADTASNGRITRYIQTYSCDCYLEHTLTIAGLPKVPEGIILGDSVLKFYPDKYKTYPVTFSIRNNDTINVTDKYGLKQGYWYQNKENNGYFSGVYVDDVLKSAKSREYYPSGKLKSWLLKRNFKCFESEDFFENGNPKAHIIQNDTSGSIFTTFYENGIIERSRIETPTYSEDKTFYPDGHIKNLTGSHIHRDYYPNGVLEKEFEFLNGQDISYRYFYDNGHLMATRYIRKIEKSRPFFERKRTSTGKMITIPTKQREYWTEQVSDVWKYYDKKGNAVSRQFLVKQGFKLEPE